MPPDSSAWIALADQLGSAARHARAVATRMVDGCGGHLLGVVEHEGPWTRSMLDTVLPDRRRMVCSHLIGHSLARPLFVLMPGIVGCWECLKATVDLRMTGEERCESCGAPGPGLGLVVAQRNQFVALGELCRSCAQGEFSRS